MNSRPASSASRAASRFSGQPACHRSGAVVANEPEQFMPNSPSLNRLAFCMRVVRIVTALRLSMQRFAEAKPLETRQQLVADNRHLLHVVHRGERYAVE